MSSEARAGSPNSPEAAGPTDELISKKTTRRRFIQGAGVAAGTASSAGAATAQSTSDKAWTEGRSGLDFSSDFGAIANDVHHRRTPSDTGISVYR